LFLGTLGSTKIQKNKYHLEVNFQAILKNELNQAWPKLGTKGFYKSWIHQFQNHWSSKFNLPLELAGFNFRKYKLDPKLKGLPFYQKNFIPKLNNSCENQELE
jgi:hypothetical protein